MRKGASHMLFRWGATNGDARFQTGCCNHNRACRRGGARHIPPPGMQIGVLTRIDRCRYFLDSSLHFFLWLYNRILARKTHCVAPGRNLACVSQKAHRLFQNLPFLTLLETQQKYLSRRNSTSLCIQKPTVAACVRLIFCAPRTLLRFGCRRRTNALNFTVG